MTPKARTANQAAADTYLELQLTLVDVGMTFPEMALSDTGEGDIRINLGRVDIGTAERLARALKARWA
ncbi:hypothetical protein ACFY12_13765 [Streptomyces sp. NPDC001339]|uniref:hypothetical protein n=1 Tax=Streptomyces sp. NPDC001339 TaxID=3364563 RepID=UPI00369B2EF9